jgi:hypothetical protein
MNLNNLKPAWQQFRLVNSMHSMDKEEILLIIDQVENGSVGKIHRGLINSIIVIVLTICCQGG